jgi:inhibitor of cysteine peptidase
MNKDKMNELKKEYDNIEVPKELDLAIENGIKKGRAYKRKRAVKPLTIIAAGIVLAFGINSMANRISTIDTPLITSDKPLIAVNSSITLPTVGSSENLQKLLKTYIDQNDGSTYGLASDESLPMMKDSVKAESSSIDSGRAGVSANKDTQTTATDHSGTNLQVEGVDEEDLVKTDGEYIYKVNSQKIINIIKTDADSTMEEVNNITFEDNYNVNGIFLRENILVVVGNSYENIGIQNSDQNRNSIKMPSSQVTKVISYDVSNKKNIKKVRDIEIDGFYNSARMIGSRVYIIANKNLNNISNIKEDANIGKVYYNDSAVGTGKNLIDFSEINYMPDSVEPNYIMVAAFNVDDNNEKVNISTILGSGNSIYSSDKNLYIAGSKWTQDKKNNNGTTNTMLYKFAYEDTGVKFVASGEVPGTITNQFSMDEKDEHFRIATTEYNYSNVWPMTLDESTTSSVAPDVEKSSIQPENQITNNLYVMDKDMNVVGKLKGLANGEQIYSVRFIGDRAYIVTFMLMDPLFVIDLKSPTNPKVLGELKIPGFSNYLHPYDETHLIGFGMDTKVINEGGEDRAQTKGMKIAIFDVGNVAKPVQEFMTTIGGAGTYSEVLNNHKALLFSKEKNLLALPVFENDYNSKTNSSQKSYQGAYIYNIDLVNGIKLKGKITHIDAVTNSNKNTSMIEGQYFVDRIIYIKDTLYTLSNGLIKANDINTLKEKSKLKLKTFDYSKDYPTDGVRDINPMLD